MVYFNHVSGDRNQRYWLIQMFNLETQKIYPKNLKSPAIARRRTNEGMQSQLQ